MKKISLVLILFFSFFFFAEEREVVFEGKKFVITFPDGYCDQTDTIYGSILLPIMKQNAINMGEDPVLPLIIFSKCGQNFNFGGANHPLGWVAIQNFGFVLSQEEANNFMEELLRDESFIDEVNQVSKKGNEKTFRDLGIKAKIKGISTDRNGWLWGDENVGIFLMFNEGLIEDKVNKERVLGALTMADEYQIGLYISDDQNGDVDFEVLTYELAINGERLAKKNR